MGKQRVFLEHGVHPALIGRHGGDVLALKKHGARGGVFKPADDPQGGGLAAAGRAQQRQKLLFADVKVNIAQNGGSVELLGYVFQFNEVFLFHHDGTAPLAGSSSEAWRSRDPKNDGGVSAGVFQIMGRIGVQAEAEALPHPIGAFARHQIYLTVKHIAELLAFQRRQFIASGPRLQLQQDGFHAVALGVRHQPRDLLVLFFLFEHVLRGVDHFFRRIVGEKLLQAGAQAFQQVGQGGDGRRGQIPLHLRNKALAQLAAIRQLLLRQVSLNPQFLQLLPNVHQGSSLSDGFCFRS